MAEPTVTAAANAITQANAAAQASTSKVGVYNPALQNTTLVSNVKNSLYGTGSLSSSSVHVGSIQSNIARALQVDPKNSDLLSAQKSMATASMATNAATRTAAYAAAQRSLQSVYNATKTAPKPTIVSTAAATVSALAGNNSSSSSSTKIDPVVADRVKNSLYGSGSLETSDPHVNSILSNISTALKADPNNQNLLNAQASLKSVAPNTSSSTKAAALSSAQKSLQAVMSGGTIPTPTPPPTPTPTPPPPTPTPTPPPVTPTPLNSWDAAALGMESSIRNSLFGTGSYEKKALNYSLVSKNIDSALSLSKSIPAANLVGSSTPNSWQQVSNSLVSAQKNMASAISNKGTDDAAGKARSVAFLSAKADLTKAESLMNSLGYDKGKKIIL